MIIDPLLQVENLETVFGREGRGPVARAVRGVSFAVEGGKTLGLSGKAGQEKASRPCPFCA